MTGITLRPHMNSFLRWFRKAPPPAVVETPTPQAPATVNDPPAVAATVEEEAAVRAAIERADHAAIARFAIEASSSRLRQLAAGAVQDPAQLKQLLREVRGRDKNVYKILRHKCDALLSEERA